MKHKTNKLYLLLIRRICNHVHFETVVFLGKRYIILTAQHDRNIKLNICLRAAPTFKLFYRNMIVGFLCKHLIWKFYYLLYIKAISVLGNASMK